MKELFFTVLGFLLGLLFTEPAAKIYDDFKDDFYSCREALEQGLNEVGKERANLTIIERNLAIAAECDTTRGGQAATVLAVLYCDGKFGEDKKFIGQKWLQRADQNQRTLKTHYGQAEKSCGA